MAAPFNGNGHGYGNGHGLRALWPLLALALPAALVVSSVWVLANLRGRSGVEADRVAAAAKLEALDAVLLDLVQGSAGPGLPGARWSELYRNYRAQVRSLDGRSAAVQEIMDSLLRVYAAVASSERIRGQLLLPGVGEEESRGLEAEFRSKLELARAELKLALFRLQQGAAAALPRRVAVPFAGFAALAGLLAIPLLLVFWRGYASAQAAAANSGRLRAAEVQMLLDLFPDPVLLVDERAVVLRANSPACDVFGYDPHEWRGLSVAALLAGGGAGAQGPALLEDLRKRTPMRTRARTREGASIGVEVVWTSASSGSAGAMALVLRAVTPQPDWWEAVAASDALAALELGLDGCVLRVNRAFTGLTGIAESAARGRLFTEVLQIPTPPGGQAEISSTGGRRIAWGIFHSGGRAAVLGLDVTDALAGRPEADPLERLPVRLAQTFGDALTAIAGYSELLFESLPSGDPLRKDAGQIRQAADRALRLLAGLLAFGERGRVLPRAIDLNQAVLDLVSRVRPRLAPEIAIVPYLDAKLGTVLADPKRIEDALLALISNAAEAMPQGGTVTIRSTRHANDSFSLTVADTGPGIGGEIRPRVFEPLFTAKDPRRALGLGLATVEGFVSAAGGQVQIESASGRGTQVTLILPLAPPTPAPELPGSEDPARRHTRDGL